MNGGWVQRAGWGLCAAVLSTSASAAVLEYSLTSLGGNNWQVDYLLDNRESLVSFDELTVYFDRTLYSQIEAVTTPAGWDALVIQPDAALDAPGFYDALRLDGPVPGGEYGTTFSVSFAYLATGTPGAQIFELLRSDPFDVVFDGVTVAGVGSGGPGVPVAPVPEPGTYALMLAGLSWVGWMGRRQRMGKKGAQA